MTHSCPTCGQHVTDPGILFDVVSGELVFRGKRAHLTPNQSSMFEMLRRAMPGFVHYERLLVGVYGPHACDYIEIDLHDIGRHIRKKIRPLGLLLVPQYGFGYALREAPPLRAVDAAA